MRVPLEIEFGMDFIEETVFLAIHELERQGEQRELVRKFHEERSRCYEILDRVGKNRFEKLYLEFFEALGLRTFFRRLAADFPRLTERSDRFLIRRAYGRKSEGAELFVRGSVRTVVTALQTTRILDLNFLSGYLRHEWTRISDMLDPAFEYDAHASLGADHEIEENLNRDRFKILWDLSIASRLLAKGVVSFLNMEDLKKQFERVFDTWLPEDRKTIYDTVTRVWPISQKALICFSAVGGRKRVSNLAPVRCPLCHFTSYRLFNRREVDQGDIDSMVREDYPAWLAEEGMCEQCFELYRSRQKVGHRP